MGTSDAHAVMSSYLYVSWHWSDVHSFMLSHAPHTHVVIYLVQGTVKKVYTFHGPVVYSCSRQPVFVYFHTSYVDVSYVTLLAQQYTSLDLPVVSGMFKC